MIKNCFKKTLLMGISTLTVLFTVVGSCGMVTYANEKSTVAETGEEGIMPFSDIIEYRYKVINGDFYRRLYNYTQEYWIGEWELVHKGNN